MTARVPAIILGGTGYVAGELLRLILGHPRLELAGDRLRQPARRAGGEGFSAPRRRLRRPALRVDRAGNRTRGRESAKRGARRRAARRLAQADRRAPESRRGRGCEALGRRHLRGFPLRGPRRVRARVQASARRTGAPLRLHLRGAGAPRPRADSACRASRLLRHGLVAGVGSAAQARPRRAADLRLGGDGQHRRGAQPDRRHAPPAPAQRPLCLQRADTSPWRRDQRARARGHRKGRQDRLRAPFRAICARHSCNGAGGAQEAARHGAAPSRRSAISTRAGRSCACSTSRRG